MTIDLKNNVFQNLANTPALNLPPGETLNLFANAGVFATGTGATAHGVVAGAANTMNIFGDIYSREGTGIFSDAGNHILSIATTGSVYGLAGGIHFGAGGNTVTNDGQITAASGIALDIIGTGANAVTNNGSILSGSDAAVRLTGAGNSFINTGTIEAGAASLGVVTVQLTNSGTIQGGTGVVLSNNGSLTNSGTIVGLSLRAVSGSPSADTIVNNGLLQGAGGIAIEFQEGADSYDGRGGRVVGEVRGGSGNDSLTGGAFVDHLVGGNQDDTLDGGSAADTLDGGNGNDTYVLGTDTTDTILDATGTTDLVKSTVTRVLSGQLAPIENLILDGTGNVNGTGNSAVNGIVGNSGNNILAGLGGNDTLLGNGGNDYLFGQGGKDNLRGDGGDDIFVYQSVADSPSGAAMRDIILDFDDSGDDLIDLTAIPGLVAGTSFKGANPFTGLNQVRVEQVGGDVLVQINTAGNTTPESEILIQGALLGQGVGRVDGADFLL